MPPLEREARALTDNREASRELVERKTRLARTAARIAGLVRFIADGDRSEYVVTALRDLEAQPRTERAEMAALEARSRSPIALPTPAEVTNRAAGLRRLFEGHPLEVREALRRYFVDGRIAVTPGPERVRTATVVTAKVAEAPAYLTARRLPARPRAGPGTSDP